MSHRWTDTVRSPVALLCFAGTAVIGVVADLWSKSAAVASLKNGAAVRFIPRVVQFEYTENHGAVFGLGQGQQALFLVVSVAAIGFLVWLFATSGRSRFYQIVLGMLLAGVIGNMSWLELEDGSRLEVFGSGGGEAVAGRLAAALGKPVPLLGSIPLEPRLREGGDTGRPIVLSTAESTAGRTLRDIAVALAARPRGLAGRPLGVTPRA